MSQEPTVQSAARKVTDRGSKAAIACTVRPCRAVRDGDFDADGGFQAATTLAGPGFESARNVAFAPDDTLLAAGCHQGELRVGSARLDTDNMVQFDPDALP